MNHDQAMATVLDIASRYAENAEEGYAHRVKATDTDSDCEANATEGQADYEDVLLVRDTWQAIELLTPKAARGSVYDYYLAKVGQPLADQSFKTLPIDSGCGADCKAAIDAGVAFAAQAEMADHIMRDDIIAHIDRTISIFWHG
jgi:hypothetical protein